jgi:Fe-S cluster biosynthesis and repair protein YggX
MCSKLKQELPAIDETSPAGDQALKMSLLLGGPDLRQRVHENVSAQAWEMWRDHMRMVINEYRLDPTADESNEILRAHLVDFLFGAQREVPNYVPPSRD